MRLANMRLHQQRAARLAAATVEPQNLALRRVRRAASGSEDSRKPTSSAASQTRLLE